MYLVNGTLNYIEDTYTNTTTLSCSGTAMYGIKYAGAVSAKVTCQRPFSVNNVDPSRNPIDLSRGEMWAKWAYGYNISGVLQNNGLGVNGSAILVLDYNSAIVQQL